jgi:hypothetical protein
MQRSFFKQLLDNVTLSMKGGFISTVIDTSAKTTLPGMML